jgi:hypothetical protein
MAKKMEIRQRLSGTFTGTGDQLLYPRTHITMVEGLVDGNSKLNISLFPDSTLNAKRMAGTINSNTNFATLFTSIQTYTDSVASLYPGCYFISNGSFTISASTDHVVLYGDDGSGIKTTEQLEQGDHIFYVRFGTEYYWNSVAGPHTAATSNRYFGTLDEMNSTVPTATGTKGVLAGFDIEKLVVDPGAPYQFTVTVADSSYSRSDVFYQIHNGQVTFWNDPQIPSAGLNFRVDTGSGYDYWKLIQVGQEENARAWFESALYSNKHFWGVINNDYPLATMEKSGLMSAADKIKLNSLFNYSHPTQSTISVTATNVDVMSNIEVNNLGHVTAFSKRTLPDASTTVKGVTQYATNEQGQTATSSALSLTPASGKAMLDYYQGMKIYSNLADANSATHPNGTIVLVEVPS